MQDAKKDRTILVAEDELEARGYLEMAVECLGYSVELAQDGTKCWPACNRFGQTSPPYCWIS